VGVLLRDRHISDGLHCGRIPSLLRPSRALKTFI
jgi:hypothetical protein